MRRCRLVLCLVLLVFMGVQFMYYATYSSDGPIVAGVKTAVLQDRMGRIHPVLTYFKRKHEYDGSYVDASSQQEDARIPEGNYIDKTVNSTAELRVSPEVVANGDEVGVAWRGIVYPSQYDWIGLYCPRDEKATNYLDYYYVKDVPSHWRTNGKFSVQVYNLRSTCEFRYYSIHKEDLLLLARSNELKFADGAEAPLQGHLSLTGHDGEMRIMWTTGSDSIPTVRYGHSNDLLNYKLTGTSKTYSSTDMCGPPAAVPKNFINPGFTHDVLLSKLQPNSHFYYQFGSGDSWSKIYSFQTPPLIGSKDTFKFITYGDMGLYAPGVPKVVELVMNEVKNGAKFVLHQGDLSYAGGYSYIWEQWFSTIEPIATSVPYMVGIGNHDQCHLIGGSKDPSKVKKSGFHPVWGNYLDDSGGECGVPPYYHFHMPDNGNSLWWYSFDYGTVHFIMISTEHNFTAGSLQYEWLEKDLSTVDRTVTAWVILAGHRPMYCSADDPPDYQVSEHIQSSLEELFYKYKVNLAVYGHYHLYERTCPVYKQHCDQYGTIHIVAGAGGVGMEGVPSRGASWSKFYHSQIMGYGRVTVVGDTELHWEYMSVEDGSVVDKTVIKR